MLRWLLLVGYVVAIYGFLPFGPRVGLAFARSTVGAWLLGPGAIVVVLLGIGFVTESLRRRGASRATYLKLLCCVVGYGVALGLLQVRRIERIHLPEYGVVAWLALRAVDPTLSQSLARYVAAGVIASVIGIGDELLQSVVPGRHYDPRDIVANVVAAILALTLLRAARSVSDGSRASG